MLRWASSIFFSQVFCVTLLWAQERIEDYSWEGFLEQGKEHYRAGRNENALYYFEKAIRWLRNADDLKKPQAAELYFLAGEALRRQGREFDAVPFYERSLYLNREQSAIYIFFGKYYATRRQYAQSAYYYSEYVRRNPEDRRAALAYALSLADDGRRSEAMQFLRSLPVRQEKECHYDDVTRQRHCLEDNLYANLAAPEPYLALVRFHELNHNTADQITISEALRRLMGEKPPYIYPAVFSYYRANQVRKAIELLEMMVAGGIADAKTYRLLADMLLEIGEVEKAAKYRRQSLF